MISDTFEDEVRAALRRAADSVQSAPPPLADVVNEGAPTALRPDEPRRGRAAWAAAALAAAVIVVVGLAAFLGRDEGRQVEVAPADGGLPVAPVLPKGKWPDIYKSADFEAVYVVAEGKVGGGRYRYLAHPENDGETTCFEFDRLFTWAGTYCSNRSIPDPRPVVLGATSGWEGGWALNGLAREDVSLVRITTRDGRIFTTRPVIVPGASMRGWVLVGEDLPMPSFDRVEGLDAAGIVIPGPPAVFDGVRRQGGVARQDSEPGAP
jgi:hypothetical protein